MKIRYIIPGPISKTELGKKEVERRLGKLKKWASSETEVDITDVDYGPASIESMFEEYLSIQGTAEEVQKAEKEGYDAVIIGCFGDPGLDGLREITDMLVVGPAGVSMSMAVTLGHKFSVVTVTDTILAALEKLAWETGVYQKLASVRAIDIPVIELNKDHSRGVERMIEIGKKAVKEDRADVLVLGCMSMGFLDVAQKMMDELGVPVINPSQASLKLAEALISCNLSHSPLAYQIPPKIRSGKTVKELLLK
ncbi:MAG: allantoin racemase [Halanaerobiales bacterium]|nr:allantoin racemase [Halanaerobiales bacterium]